MFSRNQVFCLKFWKLWRAPTTLQFNISCCNFAHVSYLSQQFESLMKIGFIESRDCTKDPANFSIVKVLSRVCGSLYNFWQSTKSASEKRKPRNRKIGQLYPKEYILVWKNGTSLRNLFIKSRKLSQNWKQLGIFKLGKSLISNENLLGADWINFLN